MRRAILGFLLALAAAAGAQRPHNQCTLVQ